MRSRIAAGAVAGALLAGVLGVGPGRAQSPDIVEPAGDTYQDLLLAKPGLVPDADADIVSGDATVSADGQTVTLATTLAGQAGNALVSWNFQYGNYTYWVTAAGGRVTLNAGGNRPDGSYAGFSRACSQCSVTTQGSVLTMTVPAAHFEAALLDYDGSVVDVAPGYVFPAVFIRSQASTAGLVPTAADRTSTVPVTV